MVNGAGIDFSATPNSSGTMTYEILDDYEEGTWTPVINKSGMSGTAGTPNNEYGYYRKIGNLLYISFYWYRNAGSFGNNTGEWYVSGIPFSLQTLTNSAYQFVKTGYHSINGTSYNTGSSGEDGGRWQSNSTNGNTTLALYGASYNTNWTSGPMEYSGSGVLMTT